VGIISAFTSRISSLIAAGFGSTFVRQCYIISFVVCIVFTVQSNDRIVLFGVLYAFRRVLVCLPYHSFLFVNLSPV
jgi:hypothetical protein